MEPLRLFFEFMHRLLGDGPLFHGVMGLLAFLLVVLGGKLAKTFLTTAGRRLINYTESDLDDKVLEIVLSRLMALAAIGGMYLGLRELRRGFRFDDSVLQVAIDYANAGLFILTAVIVTMLLIRIVSMLIAHTMQAYSMKQNASLHRALTPLMNRVVTFMIAALAVIVVMDHFGQNVNSLLTLLGAGSLAIGLAAQDTISNMISGFVIMIDRPFHIGDRIKLPTGEEGDVYAIGMRSTTILDFDNNLVVVPNNDLIRTRIVNYTYPTQEHRVMLDVNAAYGTDIDRMKSIMMREALNNPEVLSTPPPEVFLVNLADSSMQFKLICRVATFARKFAVTELLRIGVYTKMLESGIEIPYPQSVVTMKDVRPSHILQESPR